MEGDVMAKEDEFPAFPVTAGNSVYTSGMSLRDYFAGKAMNGIVAGYWSNPQMGWLGPTHHAEEAYYIADAMLAQRLKDTPL